MAKNPAYGRDLVILLEKSPVDRAKAIQLIENGASLDVENDIGDTALSLAIWQGQPDIVSSLIDHGASIESRDGNGYTPLLVALNFEQLECIDILLDAGANLNPAQDSKGRSIDAFIFDMADPEIRATCKKMIADEKERRESGGPSRSLKKMIDASLPTRTNKPAAKLIVRRNPK